MSLPASAWYHSPMHQCEFRVLIIGVSFVFSSISLASLVGSSVCSSLMGAHLWGIIVFQRHQLGIVRRCISVDSGYSSLGYHCVQQNQLGIIRQCISGGLSSISLVLFVDASVWTQGAHHRGIICVQQHQLCITRRLIRVLVFNGCSSLGYHCVLAASAWYRSSMHQCGLRVLIFGVSLCSAESVWYHSSMHQWWTQRHQIGIVRRCIRVKAGWLIIGVSFEFASISLVSFADASVWTQGAHHRGIICVQQHQLGITRRFISVLVFNGCSSLGYHCVSAASAWYRSSMHQC